MGVAPDGQLAHFNLGLAFRQKGYYAEALREYRLAAERGEDGDLLLQAMAEVHLLKKEPATAAQLYEKLLVARPDSPKLWNERGIALHQDGRYVDAAESYRRAVACDSKYALGLNNLGVALYHVGNAESVGRSVPLRAQGAAIVHQGAPEPRAAALQEEDDCRSAWRRTGRCCSCSRNSRWRGTVSGSCWWSSGSSRTRGTRTVAPFRRGPTTPRRITT